MKACDKYVAIHHPLHYSIIMREELCLCLLDGSWFLCCANALTHTLLLSQQSLCAENLLLLHFSFDFAALLKLSSSDTSLNEVVICTARAEVLLIPLSGILVSYGHIGVTILRVPSTKGICKALPTCGSHLSVMSLLYWDNDGPALFLLIKPIP